MPLVEIPDFWILYSPEGKPQASHLGLSRDGAVLCASAEAAWKEFTDTAREREQKQRYGWKVVPVDRADWEDFWFERRRPAL